MPTETSVKPSDVYKVTKEEALANVREAGYVVVDFRVPRLGEIWLNSWGHVVDRPLVEPATFMFDDRPYERLVLRRIHG